MLKRRVLPLSLDSIIIIVAFLQGFQFMRKSFDISKCLISHVIMTQRLLHGS